MSEQSALLTTRRCRNGHTPFRFTCEDCSIVALAELDALRRELARVQAEREAALADAKYHQQGTVEAKALCDSLLAQLAAANQRADDAVEAERERCANIALSFDDGEYDTAELIAEVIRTQEASNGKR